MGALLGYFFLDGASGDPISLIQVFAAGAILTMLASLRPEPPGIGSGREAQDPTTQFGPFFPLCVPVSR